MKTFLIYGLPQLVHAAFWAWFAFSDKVLIAEVGIEQASARFFIPVVFISPVILVITWVIFGKKPVDDGEVQGGGSRGPCDPNPWSD